MNSQQFPSSQASCPLPQQLYSSLANSQPAHPQAAVFNTAATFFGSSPMQLPSTSVNRDTSGMAAASSQSAGSVVTTRCAGLEYANMKKEEAREEYKDRRRKELLEQGELERVKRRKKNDASMSEDQKYHRRLKMNQDSAAAARHAQEAYVATLEELVQTAEAEKATLAMEANNLRAERDELARKLNTLHQQVVATIPAVAAANAGGASSLGGEGEALDPDAAAGMAQQESSTIGDELLQGMDDSCLDSESDPLDVLAQNDPAGTAVLVRKLMDVFDWPEIHSSLNNDPEYANSIVGFVPAPAV